MSGAQHEEVRLGQRARCNMCVKLQVVRMQSLHKVNPRAVRRETKAGFAHFSGSVLP